MPITEADIEKIAQLAHLDITDDERRMFAPQISEIVTYVEQLNAVDTSTVEPALGGLTPAQAAGLPADAKYAAPTTPVTIDQKGCMYHPPVFGIMVGQPLEIVNSDPLLHNIKAMGKANRPFNISQPAAGMKTQRTFTASEVMLPFECNVHGWMHAYAGVLPHPFFSTTGADGSFTIKDLPSGTYTIEAWQQQYGTRTATVTVQGNETKAVDFTYTPSRT